MKTNERKNKIVEILNERSFISVEELSSLLYTSASSVRRDLNELQNQGLVKRSYGGVMLFETKNAAPVSWRWEAHKNEKRLLAQRAAAYLKDYSTIFLDSSTTAYYMIEHIAQKKEITVITNNSKTAGSLIDCGVKTYCIGGYMHSNSVICGVYAQKQLEQFRADTVFFSSFALDDTGLITDSCVEENAVRKQMLSQADYRVFLCDSSKFNRRSTHVLCHIDDIDDCVFDIEPEFLNNFKK